MWKSLAAGLSLVAALAFPARAEPPVVVASVQPLHSLAAAVMQGVGNPGLLVTGLASEHSYALRPRDARLLKEAALVILVDTGYEGFLAKPLKGRAKASLAMADLPGVTTRQRREGGIWDGHAGPHGHEHGHDDDLDGHVWLDPANAKVLVSALAERLAAIDPANAATYGANAATTLRRLDALDTALQAKLKPVAGKPYVVFHDAYQYFEARYGLTPAGSITVDPDRPVAPKRLAALRDRLRQAGTSCVFREPQFPAPVVQSLADSAGARIGVLDPQGALLPPGPDHYFRLMEAMAEALVGCLGR